MRKFFMIFGLAGLLALCAINFNLDVKLEQNCTGHLKRAADANTVELAKSELDMAIKYLETTGDTIGYTSIFYETPDEDIAFWYHNLKSSYNELCNLSEDATTLETSNTLMKLRETLTDTNGNGKTIVTYPEGLERYPNNGRMLFFSILVWLLFLTSLIAIRL